ncbi:MAG: WD40 repeat domain-containing protein, partial [Dolichospermum sp.]
LKLWDLQTGKEIRTLTGHSDKVRGVAMTPDRERAVSASDDYTLKLWDLDISKESSAIGHNNSIRVVILTPDSKKAVSAADDCTLKLWDLQTNQVIFSFVGHTHPIKALVISPDGKTVISGS